MDYGLRPVIHNGIEFTIYDSRLTRQKIIYEPAKIRRARKSEIGYRKSDYFIRSKVFWRICQSLSPANLPWKLWLISASFAFLVGLLTL